jgi:uncharacterized protein YaaW (UPF0174 family)
LRIFNDDNTSLPYFLIHEGNKKCIEPIAFAWCHLCYAEESKVKKVKGSKKKYKKTADTEMKDNYEELYTTAIWELQFKNMLSDNLLKMLQEIKAMTNDKLSIALVDNAIERYNLDLLMHERNLLNNK